MAGVLSNILLALTVHGSRRHILAYRNECYKDIFSEIPDFGGKAPLGLTTSKAMLYLVGIVSLTWVILLVVDILSILNKCA